MIEFEWRIKSLTPRTIGAREGVATQIHFDLVAIDPVSGQERCLQGSYTPPLDDDDMFMPLAELTPEIVTAWLEAMPAARSYKDEAEALLIDALPPPEEEILPWEVK